MRKIYFFYFLLLLPFALNAQEVPVDNKFKGEWIFDYAIVHENQSGAEEFTIQEISELFKYDHFSEVPTEISFFETPEGIIENPFYHYFVQPLINEKHQLEFFEVIIPEDRPDDIDLHPVGPVFNNLLFGGNSISVWYNFTYLNKQLQTTTGFAQIVYKRK